MRVSLLPLMLGSVLGLSGCAFVGLAPAVVEAVQENAGRGRHEGELFAPAAEEACRGRAARHGRIEITRVEPHGRDYMRVYGAIEDPYGGPGRGFVCLFRSNGTIRSFKMSKAS
jgi:hypothetical protein